ncbi:MAG: L-histidine N(alpha)-methyltransferase [Cyanobacteriota bacterium]|nr:L-histidine N(alpha)-methyltransferase [Cyanobacteriota bacterium]
MQIQHLKASEFPNQTHPPEGEDVKKGLTQTPKTLAPQYFYDDLGSQLFEQICQLPEYYLTRTEASILQQSAEAIAHTTGSCELVELGSGSSTKTRLLLDAYRDAGYSCKYVPVDVSEGILKESALQLQNEYPTLAIQVLVGTYEQALTQLKNTSWPARIISFLGSSMGNFTPQEQDIFLERIARVLTNGDYFLLGIDLQKPKQILEAAYNDSQGVTAEFNLNILSHLNKRFQGDFDPNKFEHRAVYNSTDHQIEMYLHCLENHIANLEKLNLEIPWEAGDSIRTELSRKFDLEVLQKQLDAQGLKTLEIFTDPKEWFGLILCQSVK